MEQSCPEQEDCEGAQPESSALKHPLVPELSTVPVLHAVLLCYRSHSSNRLTVLSQVLRAQSVPLGWGCTLAFQGEDRCDVPLSVKLGLAMTGISSTLGHQLLSYSTHASFQFT